MKTSFYPTINSLKMGLHTNDVQFLDGDKTLPYVLRDGLYHYFAQGTTVKGEADHFTDMYVLVMTSSKDIGVTACQ